MNDPADDPFVVHLPVGSDIPPKRPQRFFSRCGISTRTPPGVRIRDSDDGPYLVAGPHKRYYEKCSGCFGEPDL